MKKTKVYMSKLPKCCSDCPCCNYGNDGDKDYTCNLMKYGEDALTDGNLINKIPEGCKLHATGELVKEVCEKIREYLRTQVIYCGGKATELDIMIANAGNQVLEDVKQFLDQIQKEYEK